MTTAQATTEHRRHVPWVLVTLLGLVALSTVLHLSALKRDLPLHDQDESAFVGPAVHIAATGDLNPHWFGHPGSTVIYPLAGLFHVWDVVFHHGPIFSPNSALSFRLHRYPTEFYSIGRLWSIALSLGALPLMFLIGRRLFDTRVALIATAIWAVLPFPVFHAQIVRTDSAAVFFGLLALWLCLRLFDEPRTRYCVLAGVSVGLAVSSRYFMVALIPSLVIAAVLPHRRAPRAALRSGSIAVTAAVVGFLATTPYFVLDPKTALHSVQAENAAPSPASGGLSPLGNLRWYLGTAIPRSLTWPLVALAVVGVVLVMRKPRVPQLLPLVFCATFLVGISVSDVHQQQWVIQILPVLTLIAAFAVVALTDALTAPLPRALRKPVLTPVVLIAAAVVLALDPVTTLARADADSSTGGAARDWIVAHIPPGSRLIEDSIHVPLHDTSFHVKYRLDGPARAPIHYISFGSQYLRLDRHTHTLAFYKDAGYQYLVVNGYWVDHTASNSALYPLEAAFYRDLNCHTHLIAVFGVTTLRHGWPVRVYELNAPPPPEVSVFCGEKSSGS